MHTITDEEFRRIWDRLGPYLPSYLTRVERRAYGRLHFEFAPFTGGEPEPVRPAVHEDPRLAYVDQSQDATEHRLRRIAATLLGEIYDQARRQWQDSVYVTELRAVIGDAPERWTRYEREAMALEASYVYLRTPEAGAEWPAAISRLVDAQERTLAAAIAFDERAREIARVHDKHLYGAMGHVQALTKAGYPEAKEWHVGDGFGGCFRGSLQERVRDVIKQQEDHLAKVGRLTGLSN